MGAAPLLLALAIVVADVGWESDGRGGYQYIVQVPAEQWESIKREGEVTSQIPENLRGRISSVRIRVGEGPIPRHAVVASSETTRKLPGPPDTQPTVRAQSGETFQMPDMSSLSDAGRGIVDNAKQQFSSQMNELANQAGQRVNEAVNSAMTSAVNSVVDNTANNTTNNTVGNGTGAVQAPPLQQTVTSVNQAGAPPSTRAASGPSTAPANNSTPFSPADARTFSTPPSSQFSSQLSPQPSPQSSTQQSSATPSFGLQSGSSSSATGSTNQPTTGQRSDNFAQPRGIDPRGTDPRGVGSTAGVGAPAAGPSTNPSGNLATNSPWQVDPPSLIQSGSEQSAQAMTSAQATFAMQQRLREAESKFHFDKYGDLIVDEAVLYVVGVNAVVGIDATGRLYDKRTEKWLRDNDPRYLQVINFIEQFNSVRRERLASSSGAGDLQLTNPQVTSNATFPAGRPNNLFEGTPTGPTTSWPASFTGGYPGTYGSSPSSIAGNQTQPTAAPQTAATPANSPGFTISFDEKLELAMLRKEKEREEREREREKTGSASSSSSVQQSALQGNGQAAATTGAGSASDTTLSQRKSQQIAEETQAQPIFNFMLLVSILGNAYLAIAISRLLKRYRNLVASHRGNTLAT